MKRINLFMLSLMLITFSSCELIGDIFKAGVWVGVLMVVAVVGLVIFVIGKMFGRGK